MLNITRLLKFVASGVFCAAVATSTMTMSSFGVTAAGAGLFAALSLTADEAEARPRHQPGRSPGAGRHPNRNPHRGRAPRRHQYHRKERHDDWRDFQRRRHALGFLYVASRPCSQTVVLSDGVRYYYCDSVYYRPYVDNGTTIYVIRE